MTIEQFIAQYNVRADVKPADRNPNVVADDWTRDASHYRIVLHAGPRQLTTYFSMGSAHTREPGAAEVLDSLASDASSVEYVRDFEQWADEIGYDPDSRKAFATFEVVRKQSAALKRLLGDDAYDELLNEVERS